MGKTLITKKPPKGGFFLAHRGLTLLKKLISFIQHLKNLISERLGLFRVD
jgi:hypothetical protein